jgi:hypothetical protein
VLLSLFRAKQLKETASVEPASIFASILVGALPDPGSRSRIQIPDPDPGVLDGLPIELECKRHCKHPNSARIIRFL